MIKKIKLKKKMGMCQDSSQGSLTTEKLNSHINQFFNGMKIRNSNIDQLKTKIKSQIFYDKTTNNEGMKRFFHEEIINSEFPKSSQELASEAIEETRHNYGDETLPFLSLFFLVNSNVDTFKTVFKEVNFAYNTKDMNSNNNKNYNPDLIPKEQLKNITSFYTNFITLLPVNILARHSEGGGKPRKYVTKALNSAFSKDVQNNFVEIILFNKYSDEDTINIDEFFNEHYQTLKKDNNIRDSLVDSFIKSLTQSDANNLMNEQ